MLRFVQGNLFDSQAQALVNTVNCVGVMGKGIAHQFKRAYPQMFKEYKRQCAEKSVTLGTMTVHREKGRIIINFPTKGHWRAKSRIGDIETGLDSLAATIKRESINSIAIPPLGCGNGGLAWADVRQLLEVKLSDLPNTMVEVYEPMGRFESTVAKKPKIGLSHYVLAELRVGITSPGKTNLQKAAYFFNVFTNEDYFRFERHKFGPYSTAIEPMFRHIKDYLDYSQLSPAQMVEDGLRRGLAGRDVEQLREWKPAIATVSEFVNRNVRQIEALATAHAIVRDSPGISEPQLVKEFLGWSPEKAKNFSEQEILTAVASLQAERLVERTLWGLEARTPTIRSPIEALIDCSILSKATAAAQSAGMPFERWLEGALDLAIRSPSQIGRQNGPSDDEDTSKQNRLVAPST